MVHFFIALLINKALAFRQELKEQNLPVQSSLCNVVRIHMKQLVIDFDIK